VQAGTQAGSPAQVSQDMDTPPSGSIRTAPAGQAETQARQPMQRDASTVTAPAFLCRAPDGQAGRQGGETH
jgi:hypothetical protein